MLTGSWFNVSANETDTGICWFSNNRSLIGCLRFDVSNTASKSKTIACGNVSVFFSENSTGKRPVLLCSQHSINSKPSLRISCLILKVRSYTICLESHLFVFPTFSLITFSSLCAWLGSPIRTSMPIAPVKLKHRIRLKAKTVHCVSGNHPFPTMPTHLMMVQVSARRRK